MSVVSIRNGDFTAYLQLEEIGRLGVVRYRKLLKIMAEATEENQEAVQRLAVFLPQQVRETKMTLAAGASRAKSAHKTATRQLEIFQKIFDTEEIYNGDYNQ